MKKILFVMLVSIWVGLASSPAAAGVDVKIGISIPLPPAIVFTIPPEVVVIPETYAYFVPDIDAEIFFYAGWWWRPWEGRWYRSRYHDRDWAYHDRAPAFYSRIPPGWRNDFREHRWKEHQWEQRRIPHRDMEKNWRGWQRNKYWEKENRWGLRGPAAGKPPKKRGPQAKFKEERGESDARPGQEPRFGERRPGPQAREFGSPQRRGGNEEGRPGRDRDRRGPR